MLQAILKGLFLMLQSLLVASMFVRWWWGYACDLLQALGKKMARRQPLKPALKR